MSIVKRIVVLATLAAMATSMSGCGPWVEDLLRGWFEYLPRQADVKTCANGEVVSIPPGCPEDQPLPTPDPGPVSDPLPGGTSPPDPPPGDGTSPPDPPTGNAAWASSHDSTAGAAGARAKRFRAAFTGNPVGRPELFWSSEDAGASDLVARGRFRLSLGGKSRLARRFAHGRWVSRGDYKYELASKTVSGHARVLLRFRRRGAGSLCLSVRGRAVRKGSDEFRIRGSLVAVGGTGEAAKIVASARFSQPVGGRSSRVRGRSRLRLGAGRPLPPPCATLAQLLELGGRRHVA